MPYFCITWLRLLVVVGLLGAAGRVAAQAPTWQWYGEPFALGDGPSHQTAVDAAGNVYTAGSFVGMIVFGTDTLVSAGERDMFVAKFSAGGAVQWALRVGGYAYDMFEKLLIDREGNVVVGGSYVGQKCVFGSIILTKADCSRFQNQCYGFVGKLSPAGVWLWVASAGGKDIRTMVVDDANNIVVAGELNGEDGEYAKYQNKYRDRIHRYSFGHIERLDTSSWKYDDLFYVAKISSAGSWQWVTPVVGSYPDNAFPGLAVSKTGNVYVTGTTNSKKTDFDARPEDFHLNEYTSSDGFVAKLSSEGALQWRTTVGGDESERIGSVALDSEENVLITGWLGSSSVLFGDTTLTQTKGKSFVAKLTPGGTWLWATNMASGPGDSKVFREVIATDHREFVLIATGYTDSTRRIQATRLADIDTRSPSSFLASLPGKRTWQWVTADTQRKEAQVERNTPGDVLVAERKVKVLDVSFTNSRQAVVLGSVIDSVVYGRESRYGDWILQNTYFRREFVLSLSGERVVIPSKQVPTRRKLPARQKKTSARSVHSPRR